MNFENCIEEVRFMLFFSFVMVDFICFLLIFVKCICKGKFILLGDFIRKKLLFVFGR